MSEPELIDENDDLEKLAAAAEAEDSEPEEVVTGDLETVEDQKAANERAARMAAAGIVNTMAKAVEWKWGIQYADEKKAEGVEAVAPCFMVEGLELPEWAVNLIEQCGPFIKAGAFFVGAGIGTYQVVQEQKKQEEEAKKNDKKSTERPAEPAQSVQSVSGFDW